MADLASENLKREKVCISTVMIVYGHKNSWSKLLTSILIIRPPPAKFAGSETSTRPPLLPVGFSLFSFSRM
jgi:hypothetical protein